MPRRRELLAAAAIADATLAVGPFVVLTPVPRLVMHPPLLNPFTHILVSNFNNERYPDAVLAMSPPVRLLLAETALQVLWDKKSAVLNRPTELCRFPQTH